MHDIRLFNFQGHDVRTIILDDEPWWIAADVCHVLTIANVGNALARLDDDEKNTIHTADGNRGNPNQAIVNEAGVYSLILRSRKAEAKAFKRWITHEVLPSIRKTGRYDARPDPAEIINLEVVAARLQQMIEAQARVTEAHARELDELKRIAQVPLLKVPADYFPLVKFAADRGIRFSGASQRAAEASRCSKIAELLGFKGLDHLPSPKGPVVKVYPRELLDTWLLAFLRDNPGSGGSILKFPESS